MKKTRYEILRILADLYAINADGVGEKLASVTYRNANNSDFSSINEILQFVLSAYGGNVKTKDVDFKYECTNDEHSCSTFITFSLVGKYNDDFSIHYEKPTPNELMEMRSGRQTLTYYDFGIAVRKVEYASVEDELSELGFKYNR